jgi:hypothetical protein
VEELEVYMILHKVSFEVGILRTRYARPRNVTNSFFYINNFLIILSLLF